MAWDKSKVNKFTWLGGLAILLLVSLAVISQRQPERFSSVVLSAENTPGVVGNAQRLAREKKIEDEVTSWKVNLDQLKAEIRRTKLFSKRRSVLKRIHRELIADQKLAKKELRDLQKATESQWEHAADHVEANLEKMKATFQSRLAE
jgi:hypothetical protein